MFPLLLCLTLSRKRLSCGFLGPIVHVNVMKTETFSSIEDAKPLLKSIFEDRERLYTRFYNKIASVVNGSASVNNMTKKMQWVTRNSGHGYSIDKHFLAATITKHSDNKSFTMKYGFIVIKGGVIGRVLTTKDGKDSIVMSKPTRIEKSKLMRLMTKKQKEVVPQMYAKF